MGQMMTALVTATPQEIPLRAGSGATHNTKDGSRAGIAGVPDGASLSQLAFSGLLQGFSTGLNESVNAAPARRAPVHAAADRPQNIADADRRDPDSTVAPATVPRERPETQTFRPVEDTRPSNASESRRSHDIAAPARPIHQPVKADAGASRPLTAQVTQDAPVLISQPPSALSARTAIAAQAHAQAPSSAPASATTAGDATAQGSGPQQALPHQHPKGRLTRLAGNGQPSAASINAGIRTAPGALTPQAVVPTQGVGVSAAALANAGQNNPGARPPIAPSTANTIFGGASSADFTAQRPSGPPPLPRPPAPVPPRLATNQVSVQIQKAVGKGVDQIRIQLKPADLGRVDVKLDVAPDGRVHVAVSVDNPETLDLLQRDARALQNALQDAGLRTDSDSLQFALKGHGKDFSSGGDEPSTSDETGTLADQQEQPDQQAGLATGQTGDSRIDIKV